MDRFDGIGWHLLAVVAPTLLGVIAFLTLLLTWARQRSDLRRERSLDREERLKDSQRRLDGDFTTAIGRLGEASESLRVSAAAGLITFIEKRNVEYLPQTVAILSGNLRIPQTQVVRELLAKALALALKSQQLADVVSSVDLTDAHLASLDLRETNLRRVNVTLERADLTFCSAASADLWKANMVAVTADRSNFSGANLGQARLDAASLQQSDFSHTRMASASLRGADLRNTSLRSSSLQSAHFDRADLRGARFDHANIQDAYFTGAVIDHSCMASLSMATNIGGAHFDENVRLQIENLIQAHQSGS